MPLAFCLKEARGQSCSCWVLCCGTWLLLWRRFSWRWTSWKLFCSTYLVEGTYTGWFFYFDVDLYIFCLFIIKVLLKVFLCASWTCIKCSHTTLEILINMVLFWSWWCMWSRLSSPTITVVLLYMVFKC